MADNIKIELDVSEFSRALREYAKVSSRELPEIINHAAIDVAYKAMAQTPRAQKSDVIPYESGFYNALLASGKTKYGRIVKGFRGGFKNKELAKAIYRKRLSAISYSKALWLTVAKKLGANVRSLARKSSSIDGGGHGEYVTAKKAKPFTTILDKATVVAQATFEIDGIEASHATAVMNSALQKGIDAVAKKTFAKIAKKLREAGRRHSGR